MAPPTFLWRIWGFAPIVDPDCRFSVTCEWIVDQDGETW
jgi:hypothetical protein